MAYFFAGAFLANGVSHFVHGIAGNKFQSSFASPPAVGESSTLVNVIWGLVNFLIGYVLIFGVGDFALAVLMAGLAALVAAVALALYFERLRGR